MATERPGSQEGSLEKLGKKMGNWLKDHWQDLVLGAGVVALSEGFGVTNIFKDDPLYEGFKSSGIALDKPMFDFWGDPSHPNRMEFQFNNPLVRQMGGIVDENKDYLDDTTGKAATDMKFYDKDGDGKIDYGRFQGEDVSKFQGTLDKPWVDTNNDYFDDRTGKVSIDMNTYDTNHDGKFDYGSFQGEYIDLNSNWKADTTGQSYNTLEYWGNGAVVQSEWDAIKQQPLPQPDQVPAQQPAPAQPQVAPAPDVK